MIDKAPFLTVVDTALDRYVARSPLYLASAGVIAALGSAGILFGKLDDNEALMLSLVLLAPLHGIVAVGTSRSLQDESLSARAVIMRVLLRWPELLVCQIVVFCISTLAISALFNNDLGSMLMLIPFTIAWGAISLADVIIVVDDPQPAANFFMSLLHRMQFLAHALTGSLGYLFRFSALGRMASLAIIQLPCVMLAMLMKNQLQLHHFAVNEALMLFLLSCTTDGFYEAIFTHTLQRLREA